ncbi:hypothetical protein PMIN06_010466 [Paraphaeosphaeria minitans]|uniref:Subtelomeric hrmA-associated cluster protein AFUB-079030/YDR124W-like helical bundle domain-containing protein n=1 Tax=Paraphaeosphaeria minitans TaxID=565426 RepID=A0A9P6GEH9_9PLEO|nr:hypothetical protein PMIN01_08176 [Paraphaeosphaeria minitans]
MFSIAQNSDYVPPDTKRAAESRAVKAGDEAPALLKSRIPLGFLTVNGRKEPVFKPISGFEHLFYEDVAAPTPPPFPQDTGKSRETQATETACRSSAAVLSRKPPSRKRQRTHNRDHHDAQYANEEGESTANITTSFSIGDVDSLKNFYTARFRELTMKPLRDIVTAWVKRLEPKRQKKYGPYHQYSDTCPDQSKPPWWPVDVPYVEPSHLRLEHLIPLAVDIMLIHRRIDKEASKQKYPSWIRLLETDAVYLISSKEIVSSARAAEYNEAMKERALEVILPSLFNIAKSHEDYVAQYNLYEGSGNEAPGCGKQVSWQAIPLPEYRLRSKRLRLPRKEGFLYNDDSAETEADKEAARPISLSPPFDLTIKYTEDVRIVPSPVPDEPPPTSEVAATQPLYQPPTPTSDAPMVSAVDHHSMDRLYEGDSKPHLAFGISQPLINVAPHRSIDLPYETIQSYYVPNDFATCGLVVPHNVALGGALEPYLPNSSDMHGLPDSIRMHGLSDGSQMHSVSSGQWYGLHQGSAHNFFTHSMPLVANWSNLDVLL